MMSLVRTHKKLMAEPGQSPGLRPTVAPPPGLWPCAQQTTSTNKLGTLTQLPPCSRPGSRVHGLGVRAPSAGEGRRQASHVDRNRWPLLGQH